MSEESNISEEIKKILDGEKERIKEQYTSFNLNVTIPSYDAMAAQVAFDQQSEAKKNLPLTRFWQPADTLADKAVQSIAGEITKGNYTYNRDKASQDRNDAIDGLLKKVSNGIAVEEIQKHIEEDNELNKDRVGVFYNSLKKF